MSDDTYWKGNQSQNEPSKLCVIDSFSDQLNHIILNIVPIHSIWSMISADLCIDDL